MLMLGDSRLVCVASSITFPNIPNMSPYVPIKQICEGCSANFIGVPNLSLLCRVILYPALPIVQQKPTRRRRRTNVFTGYFTCSASGVTWSTLGWAPSRVLRGGNLLMKLPSSTGNWVKACGGFLTAGGCGRGPGPGAAWCGPGPFAKGPGR